MNVKVTSRRTLVEAELNKRVALAMELVASQMERHAIEVVPVDTGTLKQSISHLSDDNTAVVGTNVEYAPYVEFGTSNMGAQPYLAPSINNYIGNYKAIIEKILQG